MTPSTDYSPQTYSGLLTVAEAAEAFQATDADRNTAAVRV